MPYIIKKINNKYKVCKKNDSDICFSNKGLDFETAKKQRTAIIVAELNGRGENLYYYPKNYIEIVRWIASQYGYDFNNIHYANDGKYKFVMYHQGKKIKFGKYGMNDFILYLFSGDIPNALLKRNLYLKRSKNIKGNWANDMYSKNNLSRKILWMA